jgi:hypothetical protein
MKFYRRLNCYILNLRSLCWADHSSREFLLIVVCLTECDREASKMRGPWPTRGCRDVEKNPIPSTNWIFVGNFTIWAITPHLPKKHHGIWEATVFTAILSTLHHWTQPITRWTQSTFSRSKIVGSIKKQHINYMNFSFRICTIGKRWMNNIWPGVYKICSYFSLSFIFPNATQVSSSPVDRAGQYQRKRETNTVCSVVRGLSQG